MAARGLESPEARACSALRQRGAVVVGQDASELDRGLVEEIEAALASTEWCTSSGAV